MTKLHNECDPVFTCSDLELAALLKASQSAGGELSAEDWSKLAPGSVVQTTVDSHSDFGLVVDIANFPVSVAYFYPVSDPSLTHKGSRCLSHCYIFC